MTPQEYAARDAHDLAALIRSGAVSQEAVHIAARRVAETVNPAINAVVQIYEDQPSPKAGGTFTGVPYLLKDLSATEAGRPIEAGSRLLKGNVATTTSRLVEKLALSGLVNIGRSTSSEFGTAGTTETAAFGITRNPWDLDRIAGGSSGGAAAAVAAGIVPIAHASDGGGSIRIPAACCGLVGLKPSRGRISPAPNPDSLGGWGIQFAVTRSIRDARALFVAVAGAEPGDLYGSGRTIAKPAVQNAGGLRIAFTSQAFDRSMADAKARAGVENAANKLTALGHRVEEAGFTIEPDAWYTTMADIWAAYTAKAVVDRIEALGLDAERDLPDLLEPVNIAFYHRGLRRSATDLLQAYRTVNTISRQSAAFFERYDVLLTPTLGTGIAPKVGRYQPFGAEIEPEAFLRQWSDLEGFLPIFNATGQPALSIPLEVDTDSDLPIGIQLVAQAGADELLLDVAEQLETAFPWSDRRPSTHGAIVGL